MSIIFHIAKRQSWDQGRAGGSYQPEMFASEGFIHCSTADQVIAVANNRFRGDSDLVLLAIDTTRVIPTISYENLEGGTQLFPHIYGELDPGAVVNVYDFPPGVDGCFTMPAAS
jgi:uncharacterized protein (DUF952 family)